LKLLTLNITILLIKLNDKIDMHTIVSDNIDRIKSLCKTHNVQSLFVFGSVCTDKFSNVSDIDLLVSFKPMNYGDYADLSKFEWITIKAIKKIATSIRKMENYC
jgi:predicted nucleotidyltransferase